MLENVKFSKKIFLFSVFLLCPANLFANEKDQIIAQLNSLNSLEFTFSQLINEKKEKTYEQYQEEKALKKELQDEALEKKKCTNIKIDQEGVESCIDEIDWNKVDKDITPKPELEEVKNENDNETVDTSTSTN